MSSVTTRHRFALVTVHAVDYVIVDIGLRMLRPRELFNAQGFASDYVIDPVIDGKRLTARSIYSLIETAYEICLRDRDRRKLKPATCKLCGWQGKAVRPEWYWCGVCEARTSAEKHEQAARRFRARERELGARRKETR